MSKNLTNTLTVVIDLRSRIEQLESELDECRGHLSVEQRITEDYKQQLVSTRHAISQAISDLDTQKNEIDNMFHPLVTLRDCFDIPNCDHEFLSTPEDGTVCHKCGKDGE